MLTPPQENSSITDSLTKVYPAEHGYDELVRETETARNAIFELLVSSLDRAMLLTTDENRTTNGVAIEEICSQISRLASMAQALSPRRSAQIRDALLSLRE